jgi:ribonuclease T2
MDRNWATLSCKSSDSADFWSHEWERHGSCSSMDQHSYFAAALRLNARFNLTRILLDAGVVPSDERMYSVSSIREAIGEATAGVGAERRVQPQRAQRDAAVPGVPVRRPRRHQPRPMRPCPVMMPGRCTDLVKFPAF